jgi:hypothetical protein
MTRVCSVCSHANREAIDAAIIAAVANRRIASQHGVTEIAVRRHKASHLAKQVKAASLAEGRTLLAGIKEARALVQEVVDRLHSEEGWPLAMQLESGALEMRLKCADRIRALNELEFGTKQKVTVDYDALPYEALVEMWIKQTGCPPPEE